MWWYSKGIRACFRFRSLSIFCVFSGFVAFALYKPDEKQDAPATLQRNVAFILIPALFHWCCLATPKQCSFCYFVFSVNGSSFCFYAVVFAFVSQASLRTELGELKISVAKWLGALYIIKLVSFSSTESA